MFLITLPIFLIIAAGWLMRHFGIAKNNWISILNNFAYYIALPALIVASFWEIDFFDSQSFKIIFLSLLTMILFSVLVFITLLFLKIDKKLKATIFLSATVGNTVYMGFPLVDLSFGQTYFTKGVLAGVVYLIIPLLVSIFIIRYWRDNDNLLRQLADFLKNPLMLSVFVGIILSFFNLNYSLIGGLKKSLIMLGATASPVALFTLGEFLYGRFLNKEISWALLISVFKILVFPLVIFLTFLFIAKSKDFEILTLLSSMPVAVTTFVIAEKFNLNKELVGNSLFISTILSFIIIPIILLIIK